ncbi:MAG: glycosyltransferase family 1 protein [Calditrichaeota bacterium]|nr:MAG: glycosyltransferase family 1 protein [Calditrichota bacterium]
MKIGFYVGKLSSSGVGSYTICIIKMLVKDDNVHKVILIVDEGGCNNINSIFDNNNKIEVIELRNSKLRKVFTGLNKLFYFLDKTKSINVSRFANLIAVFDPFRNAVDSLQIDICHVPMQTAPGYNMKTPLVISMHDLQELHYPAFFSPRERMLRALNYMRAIELANHIVVSFNHVRNDIITFFAVPKSKVSVCPPDFGKYWVGDSKHSDQNKLEKKYSLPNSFIFFPAQLWKHKNHQILFKALVILKERKVSILLVCTGKKDGFYQELWKHVNKLNLTDQVKFIGNVSNEDLNGLYKMARLVVIPTLYEAGSGPLFEAMYHGTPVICSNVTSLPESIGYDEFIFDPLNEIEIANLIEKGCFDNEFREKNIENSQKRIQILSQSNSSSNFIEAYNKAIDSKLNNNRHFQ